MRGKVGDPGCISWWVGGVGGGGGTGANPDEGYMSMVFFF